MLWNCHELKWTKRDSYWLFGGNKKRLHSTPTSLFVLTTLPIYLWYLFCPPLFPLFPSLLLPVVSHFSPPSSFPYTSPFLSLSPLLLLLPSILVSICCVWACLHGWRKGKERRGLLWIIHAATVVHQSSWDPPDACPPDSLLLSRLLLFTCTLCVFCCLYFYV